MNSFWLRILTIAVLGTNLVWWSQASGGEPPGGYGYGPAGCADGSCSSDVFATAPPGRGRIGGGLLRGGLFSGRGNAKVGGGKVGGLLGGPGGGGPAYADAMAAQYPNVTQAAFGWAQGQQGPTGYPASAMPYPPLLGGGAPAGDVWANGGGGYANLGGTCCGPHWWDLMAQGVFMKRDNGNNVNLMSQGIAGNAPPNIVQSTDDLNFNYEAAFRVGGQFQTSAVGSIEAIYLGGLDWDDRITYFSPNHDLYSPFSQFGNVPFGGFEDSDQATSSTLWYDSELDSVEINCRRGWVSPNHNASGAWLLGVRYVSIDEAMRQRIDVSPHFDPINMIPRGAAFTDYNIHTTNDLVGVQIGSELIKCLTPGITFGGECKVGIYGNNAEQVSTIVATTLPGGLNEMESDGGAAFMSNGNVFALWQFHPLFKLRLGYEVMYFEGIATAAGNYNSAPFVTTDPVGNPVNNPVREVRLNDHDDLLFHGFHLGLEFGW